MEYKRSERVAGGIKSELSNIIHKDIKDPLIGFVTITNVVLTDDLKIAKVFFSVFGNKNEQEKSYKGLMRAKGFLRREISSRLRLKYVPELRFYIDDTHEKASKIDEIIKKIEEGQ